MDLARRFGLEGHWDRASRSETVFNDASIDAAVVATGSIIVAGHSQTVQHLDGGIARAIHVSEGAGSKEGNIVLELDDTEFKSQERALGGRIVELEAQRARILAEDFGSLTVTPPARWATMDDEDKAVAEIILDRQSRELSVRVASNSARPIILRHKVEQFSARVPGLEHEKQALESKSNPARTRSLGLRRCRPSVSPLLAAFANLSANMPIRKGRSAALNPKGRPRLRLATHRGRSYRSADIRVYRASELQEVDTNLSDIAPRYQGIVADLGRARLRAPAGHVVALTAGGVIEPHAHVMDVVPTGKSLVIEVSAPPEHGTTCSSEPAPRLS